MSRKPVNIEVAEAGGKPYGRRAVWAAMREMKTFNQVGLRLRLPHVSKCIIDDYIKALIYGGFVQRGPMVKNPNGNDHKVRQYQLIRDIGVDAPRLKKDGTVLPPTSQQIMWQIMQIKQSFTAAELAGLAGFNSNAGDDFAIIPLPLEAVEKYLYHLHKAGYLSVRGQGEGALYKLVNDTGGYAPLVQRTKVVFDPNLNRVMWHGEIET